MSGPRSTEHPAAPATAHVDAAVRTLEPLLKGPVDAALILGTGLGGLADLVEAEAVLPYADIPGFPSAGVSGHAGRLVVGMLEGHRVAVLQGRAHYYESGDAGVMRAPIETLARLGTRLLVATNAAGSLRIDMQPGEVAVVSDHINFSGTHPLIGDRDDRRFVSLTDAYAPRLRASFRQAADAISLRLHEGVYVWMSGPAFETPAEIRMLRMLGGDLVGMSTVPEVILARRFGMEVAALSVITNLGAGIENASPSHAETREVAARGGLALQRLIPAFLKGLDHG